MSHSRNTEDAAGSTRYGRRHRLRPVWGLIAATVLMVAGCGSSSSSGPTKAQFSKSANAVCDSYQNREQALYSKLNSAANAKQAEADLTQAISVGKTGIAKLKSLSEPKSEKSQLSSLFNSINNSFSDLQSVDNDLKDGKTAQAKTQLQSANHVGTTIKADYQKLGLTACANG